MDNNFEKEKSAKKLVQARLPFKVLSAVEKNKLVSNSTDKLKPKENAVVETDSNFKEIDVEDSKLSTDEIIILSEEDEDQAKDNKSEKFESNTHRKTPDNKAKMFIKLPLSSKKKRKSSALNRSLDNAERSNQDEMEKSSPEIKSNPNKKVKISDCIAKPKYNTSNINCEPSNSVEYNSNNIETTSILICDNSKPPRVMEIDPNNDFPMVEIFERPIATHKDKDSNFEDNNSIIKCKNLIENFENIEERKKCNGTQELDSKDLNLIQKKDKSIENKEQLLTENDNDILENSIADVNLDELETESGSSQGVGEDKSLNSLGKNFKEQNDKSNQNSKSPTGSGNELKTPKSEQKRKEKEQKRIQERFEREEKRRKEKEEREKKRLAEMEAKNEEKRLKEEEKRKKEELKEEEKRKKEELKDEERRKKEERKEEEKRKKEEEKKKKEMEREEIENKKRKAAEVFTKFFVQSRNTKGTDEANLSLITKKDNVNFMPFQIKDDMKLAPITRRRLEVEQKKGFDEILQSNKEISCSELYIEMLKSGNHNPMKSAQTLLKMDDEDDDVTIIDEIHGIAQYLDSSSKASKKYKAKFFCFCENRRPPYYGTWRKRSSLITPRKPFGTDKTVFDYEIDSDLEWEEEEPGESLSCSDGEKESEDDYEVDNDFFVPHGHLSEEEMEEEDKSPEAQKAKLKILQQEFACEMKKKTEKIKPRLIGVVWIDKSLTKPETCPHVVWEFLKRHQMIYKDKVSISFQSTDNTENLSPIQQEKQKINKRSELPEELIAPLIKLVHGNKNKKLFIIKEFQAHLLQLDNSSESMHFTKSCIREKINKMAQWKLMKNTNLKRNFMCWVVSSETLKNYDLENLELENKWKYIIPPKKKKDIVEDEELKTKQINKSNENLSSITKFTKLLTKQRKKEMLTNKKEQKILISENLTTIEEGNALKKIEVTKPVTIKKRVPILFSVPRGQNIPEATKNGAVDDYLKHQMKTTTLLPNIKANAPENDDCIIIE